VDAWLAKASEALAAEAGVEPDALRLSDAEVDKLLDLARIAAHVSGDRTNAPLVCYLVGRVRGDRALEPLVDAVRRSTP
jgi:Domain of unknown function (DUF6457)